MKREKIDHPFDLQINDTQWKEHKISALIRSSKKQSSSPESLKNIRTKTWRKNGPNALRSQAVYTTDRGGSYRTKVNFLMLTK